LQFAEEGRKFSLDAAAFREAIGPQTAVVIVNTPHNPSGLALSRDELEAIADVVRENPHVSVISDEVYKYMIFDPPDISAEDSVEDLPTGHVHFAALPGMWDRTLTVSSAGKTFGVTGWQIGWIVGARHWLEPIHRYMPNMQFCAPTLMQRALRSVLDLASEPYRGESNYYSWLRDEYSRKRLLMVSALEIAGVHTVESNGGFFLLADVRSLCGVSGPLGDVWSAVAQPGEPQDWTFCRALAAKLGIVALPMSPFFGDRASGSIRDRFVRFCFAKTDDTLAEAAKRFRQLKGHPTTAECD